MRDWTPFVAGALLGHVIFMWALVIPDMKHDEFKRGRRAGYAAAVDSVMACERSPVTLDTLRVPLRVRFVGLTEVVLMQPTLRVHRDGTVEVGR